MKRSGTVGLISVLLVIALIGPGCMAQSDQDDTDKQASILFVQTAVSGSFTPVEGSENSYTLTLKNVSPATVYFSDRPERIAGHLNTKDFLDRWGKMGFQNDPPNAAVDVPEADDEVDLVVVKLSDQKYDPEADTLKYTASVIKQPNHDYAVFNELHDGKIPDTFNEVSLFIDSSSCSSIGCSIGRAAGQGLKEFENDN